MLLFRHDGVEDYFDAVDAQSLDEARARSIATAYEDGKAILLQGLKPDFDQRFMAELQWSGCDELKKLKSVSVVAHHDAVKRGKVPAIDPAALRNTPADQYAKLLQLVFRGDKGKLSYFVEQIKSLNAFLLNTTKKIFPDYRYTSQPMTWRLSDTINENLHFDVYNKDLPDHHVRMFVNLDAVHRIWHTSHRLEVILRDHLHRLPREFIESATPGRICHRLNFEVFGGFECAGREGALKHIAFFEPGEVWLVDSRKVSHQIFYGRRAVSTDFQVEQASMIDPSKHYYEIVERARRRVLEPA